MTEATEAAPLASDWVCPVIKISIPWMLEVVAAIDRLDVLTPNMTRHEAFAELFGAQFQLEQLFGNSVYGPYLRISREKANAFHLVIRSVIGIGDTDAKWDHPLGASLTSIKSSRDHFKPVFISEISTLPVFLVSPKDNYDVTLLIEHGAGLFPPMMLAKAPDAAFDAGEVGKALAFNLPTACGFHTFRVVECVLRRYWDAVTDGETRPAPQTIGKMAADLDSKGKGDAKVIEALKQFAKLHRNPCIHPDVVLTDEDAIGTLGIARSVIAMMLSVLPDAPPPTTVASSAG